MAMILGWKNLAFCEIQIYCAWVKPLFFMVKPLFCRVNHTCLLIRTIVAIYIPIPFGRRRSHQTRPPETFDHEHHVPPRLCRGTWGGKGGPKDVDTERISGKNPLKSNFNLTLSNFWWSTPCRIPWSMAAFFEDMFEASKNILIDRFLWLPFDTNTKLINQPARIQLGHTNFRIEPAQAGGRDSWNSGITTWHHGTSNSPLLWSRRRDTSASGPNARIQNIQNLHSWPGWTSWTTWYPLVICYIAIENGHRNSGFSH